MDENINSIAATNPEIAELFYNPSDALKYTCNSTKKSDFKCPECHQKVRNKIVRNVYRYGLSCPFCSDGISFGEKLVYSLLSMKSSYLDEEDFIHDQTQEWSGDKRYDFYFTIDRMPYIVEVDGGQHTTERKNSTHYISLEYQKENDKFKEELAFNNGVLKENFIRIDCLYSDYDYIKQNIINSPLYDLLKLENFDWDKCFRDASKSRLVTACNLWNDGVTDCKVIASKMKLADGTIRSYLKRGAEINLCDYEGIGNRKKVKCINDDKVFNSISEANRAYGIKGSSSISRACNGMKNSCGKHPITGEPLKWEYVS